jgi:hypothetical protein
MSASPVPVCLPTMGHREVLAEANAILPQQTCLSFEEADGPAQ